MRKWECVRKERLNKLRENCVWFTKFSGTKMGTVLPLKFLRPDTSGIFWVLWIRKDSFGKLLTSFLSNLLQFLNILFLHFSKVFPFSLCALQREEAEEIIHLLIYSFIKLILTDHPSLLDAGYAVINKVHILKKLIG